jgi:hypothetical protein
VKPVAVNTPGCFISRYVAMLRCKHRCRSPKYGNVGFETDGPFRDAGRAFETAPAG